MTQFTDSNGRGKLRADSDDIAAQYHNTTIPQYFPVLYFPLLCKFCNYSRPTTNNRRINMFITPRLRLSTTHFPPSREFAVFLPHSWFATGYLAHRSRWYDELCSAFLVSTACHTRTHHWLTHVPVLPVVSVGWRPLQRTAVKPG